ncbi:hypothetical protein JCM11641_003305 [Rhodosporidiobolus odoratus]
MSSDTSEGSSTTSSRPRQRRRYASPSSSTASSSSGNASQHSSRLSTASNVSDLPLNSSHNVPAASLANLRRGGRALVPAPAPPSLDSPSLAPSQSDVASVQADEAPNGDPAPPFPNAGVDGEGLGGMDQQDFDLADPLPAPGLAQRDASDDGEDSDISNSEEEDVDDDEAEPWEEYSWAAEYGQRRFHHLSVLDDVTTCDCPTDGACIHTNVYDLVPSVFTNAAALSNPDPVPTALPFSLALPYLASFSVLQNIGALDSGKRCVVHLDHRLRFLCASGCRSGCNHAARARTAAIEHDILASEGEDGLGELGARLREELQQGGRRGPPKRLSMPAVSHACRGPPAFVRLDTAFDQALPFRPSPPLSTLPPLLSLDDHAVCRCGSGARPAVCVPSCPLSSSVYKELSPGAFRVLYRSSPSSTHLSSFVPTLSVPHDAPPALEEHLILPVRLSEGSTTADTFAMVDSGSQGNLLDEQYARALRLPLIRREVPIAVKSFDGHTDASSALSFYTSPVRLQVGSHIETVEFNVSRVAHYPIILGIPWLRAHDVSLHMQENRVSFRSPFCEAHCLPVPPSTAALHTHPSSVAAVKLPAESPGPAASSAARPCPECPILTEPSPICPATPRPSTPAVHIISAAAARLALRQGTQGFTMTTTEVVPRLRSAAAALRRSPADPTTDDLATLRRQVPGKYHEWLDVFSKASADSLPEHRPYDLKIDIEDGKTIPAYKIYPLSAAEMEVLADYIENNLRSGFIRPSQSSVGFPILFIKKKDGSLRLCVDYRNLNSVTRKNRKNKYPLPLISDTLDQLAGAKYFTKLDLRNGYHQLRIAEGHEWKTAFRSRYGSFEYQVMPFGLTNAPAAFQHLINDTFRPFIDVFVVVYLDDILIYSDTREQHEGHVRQVLDKMREARLFAKAEKCSFDESSTEYLGFIVDRDGVRMDPQKLASVSSWPVPTTLREVQSFLGFANFYRRFIKDYSRIAHPLTRLIRKQVSFEMDPPAVDAFHALKKAFDPDILLRHFDPTLPIELETDASDYALGSVLSQRHADGRLYPVAFRSRKFDAAELNYEVHDKELLAIIDACRAFRPYLEYAHVPTTVYSDHANLQYFFSSRVLNRRKTDALSRRTDYAEGSKASESKPVVFFPRPSLAVNTVKKAPVTLLTIAPTSLARALADPFPELADLTAVAQDQDDDIRQILQDRRLDENTDDHDSRWTLDDSGLLRWDGRVHLPDIDDLRLLALRKAHDLPSAGHLGVEKTLERLRRSSYFPGDRKLVERYVGSCDTCFRNKSRRSAPHGLLQPLPPPSRPWSSMALDFIVKLPTSQEGNDSILVIVDRFTKFAHFIPCTEAGTDAPCFAQLFFDNILPLHGLPEDIVSDRGAVFDSAFWQTLTRLTRQKLSMSTAYHPQSDGITERLNQTLEQYLRMFVNYQQDDWQSLLPLAAFVYNDTVHSATKTTPFIASYGFHPRFDVSFDPSEQPTDADASAFASRLATLHQVLQHELGLAAQRMKAQADQLRRPAPSFDIGQIEAKVGPSAYRPTLPPEVRLHPVFHVSLLHPHRDNPFPDRLPTPPPLTIIDGQPEMEVQEVLDSQTYYGKLRYLVRWKGLTPRDDSWEPAENLENATDLVRIFHEKYPNKPTKPAERRSARGGIH